MVYFQEDFPENGKIDPYKNTKPEEIGDLPV
jgi:hypothetical protein